MTTFTGVALLAPRLAPRSPGVVDQLIPRVVAFTAVNAAAALTAANDSTSS